MQVVLVYWPLNRGVCAGHHLAADSIQCNRLYMLVNCLVVSSLLTGVVVKWMCHVLHAGNWTYTHTIRRPEINDESPEVRTQIGVREYEVSVEE